MVLFAYGAGSIADLPHRRRRAARIEARRRGDRGAGGPRHGTQPGPDRQRASIAALALILMLLVPGSLSQVGTIVLGGIAGIFVCRARAVTALDSIAIPVSRGVAFICLVVALVLLGVAFVPARARWLCSTRSIAPAPSYSVAVMSCSLAARCGRGTGMGQRQLVPRGLRRGAGGARSAVHVRRLSRRRGGLPPGGVRRRLSSLWWRFSCRACCADGDHAVLACAAASANAQAALRGTNAAVVGVLGAALYNPVRTSAVQTPADFAVAATGFVLLIAWRAPPFWWWCCRRSPASRSAPRRGGSCRTTPLRRRAKNVVQPKQQKG